MSDQQQIVQSIWSETIAPYDIQLQKLFASIGWKKAILPYLKAHRENRIRTILNGQNIDVNRGFVLALEMLANLPAALDAMRTQSKAEQTPAADFDSTPDHIAANLEWDDSDSAPTLEQFLSTQNKNA